MKAYRDQLESKRLVTRFLTREDVVVWSNFFNDREAVELFPPALFGNGDPAAAWVERQLERYKNGEMGLQALVHKNTGEFIGQCGLMVQEVDGEKQVEVGYHVFRKYWGQGYAPEAAGLFMSHAFDDLGLSAVISIIDRRNVRSQRVAEKNGLFREKETQWKDMEVYIYRIDRQQYHQRSHHINNT